MASAEDVIEELPDAGAGGFAASGGGGFPAAESVGEGSLTGSQKRIYELLSVEQPRPIDDIVETNRLNSSEVLATLFDLDMKGWCGNSPESSSARCCCKRRS